MPSVQGGKRLTLEQEFARDAYHIISTDLKEYKIIFSGKIITDVNRRNRQNFALGGLEGAVNGKKYTATATAEPDGRDSLGFHNYTCTIKVKSKKEYTFEFTYNEPHRLKGQVERMIFLAAVYEDFEDKIRSLDFKIYIYTDRINSTITKGDKTEPANVLDERFLKQYNYIYADTILRELGNPEPSKAAVKKQHHPVKKAPVPKQASQKGRTVDKESMEEMFGEVV